MKGTPNNGNIANSKAAVFDHYHKLTDEVRDVELMLCYENQSRYTLYHKRARLQLLMKLMQKLLSKYSSDTIISLEDKIGLPVGLLSRILRSEDYMMDIKTEIKIYKFIYIYN